MILRGGKAPNYDAASVAMACRSLEDARLPSKLMIDCSHANSMKEVHRQIEVAHDIAIQVATGSRRVFGVMVESHLQAGAQKFTPGQDSASALEYGMSITDACLGWGDSLHVIEMLAEAVERRRVCQAGHPVRIENGATVYSMSSTSPDAAFVDLTDAMPISPIFAAGAGREECEPESARVTP